MKKIAYLHLFVIVFVIIDSCKSDPEPLPEPLPMPTIVSLSPTRGVADTDVTITGTGFEVTTAANSVKFNGIEAVVVSANTTQIVAKAPAAAGTGKVSVTTAGGTVEGPEFTYLNPPTISSVDPLAGGFGALVTVTGTNFSTTPSGNTVKINDMAANVTSATTTQLTIEVPVGAGTGKLTVTTADGTVDGPEFVYKLTTVVSTLAGDGTQGYQDGTGTNAKFDTPAGLAFDANDNLFVADRNNNRIRKITPEGVVTTVYGNGENLSENGNGTSAKLSRPIGLLFDSQGNLYVTEAGSGNIRKITPNGDVTTIAGTGSSGYTDGPALSAQFSFPAGIVKDSNGNLFIADFGVAVIRKITIGGDVSTIAGDGSFDFADGTGSAAKFNSPWGLAIDANDNLYASDFANNRIRKITSGGVVTTLAGSETGYVDGPGATAKFNVPYGVAFDSEGNLIVAEGNNRRVRSLSPDGIVSTIAGTGAQGSADGKGTEAQFGTPYGIAINSKGEIFVTDRSQFTVRKLVFK